MANLFCAIALSQIPEGVWVSSHELRLGTWRDLQIDEEWRVVMQRTFNEDSVYSEGGTVLWIDSTKTVRRLADIRSDLEKGTYTDDDERLAFENDTLYFRMGSDTELTLIRGDREGLRFESYFHRLPDSELSLSKDRSVFPQADKSLYLMVTDTTNRSFQLDLVSDRKVIISRMQANTPYSAHGTWHSKWVGNTLFFSFFDHFTGAMQLYHFHGDSANMLIGGTYNDAKALGAEPPELRVTLSALDKAADTAAIRNNLIGRWEATNEPLFYDSAIEFGYLSFQSFEISFDAEGNYTMMKSGTVLKNGDSVPLDEVSEGKWEVGSRGTYLILTPIGENPFCFHLANMGTEKMEAYCYMRALTEYENFNVFENRQFLLKKREL